MSNIVYKKTLKGTEEVAFKTYGLSARMRPYLLVVDGQTDVGSLQATHVTLQSLELILKSLADEGFLEAVAVQALPEMYEREKVVNMPLGRGSFQSVAPPPPMAQPAPLPSSRFSQESAATSRSLPTERVTKAQLDAVKAEMIKDLSALLGKDAPLVINKVNGCLSSDELFASLMGLRKIIGMYAGVGKAESFSAKFAYIATL
jgi:hypothetical protein